MGLYLYKFVPRRPGFPADMSEAEATVMGEHVAYWRNLADRGTAVAFGPVADPSGSWGIAIVEADNEEDVRTIRANDPVVTIDLGPVEIFPMPNAITRGRDDAVRENSDATSGQADVHDLASRRDGR